MAISTYQTTLSKMESLRVSQDMNWETITYGTFEGYRFRDGIKSLTFKVRASIAASYLKSQRYADVISHTDDLLRCDYDPSSCTHYEDDESMHTYIFYNQSEWVKDQGLDCAKAYYCNSIALMRVGETARAVERMQRALEFDPEDSAISAQLMILKRKAEKEKS